MRTYTIPEGSSCFVYQAAILCHACGQSTREELISADSYPGGPHDTEGDIDDEETYDSDNFPKGPYDAEQDETCDRMDACLSLEP